MFFHDLFKSFMICYYSFSNDSKYRLLPLVSVAKSCIVVVKTVFVVALTRRLQVGWIQRHAIERIKRVLENEKLNFAEIAEEMNFSSRSFLPDM